MLTKTYKNTKDFILKLIPPKEDRIRPWGEYEILSSAKDYKIKKIRVKPHKRLSYQSHLYREEHWIITQGKARVTLNDKTYDLQKDDFIHIKKEEKHRIENIGDIDLYFIEVQIGEKFDESDIIRYQDDFGRLN